ncbi:MAG: efflux RND transporter periplasmic adaptor subunit [Longimicrobiales bacterium]
MSKRTLLILAGLLVGAVALTLLLGGDGVPVEVATLDTDTLTVTIDEEGRTRVRDRFVVAAPTSGRIGRTDVEEGQEVRRGDLLVTLAPAPEDPRARATNAAAVESAEARVQEARAAVRDATAALEQAEREVERRRPLMDMGALSREAFERFERMAETARTRREAAQATLEAAEAGLRGARARLMGSDPDARRDGVIEVRAPVDGTVLRVHEESERVLPAGTPLFELGAPSPMDIVVDVLTEDAVDVRPGAAMTLTGWGGDPLHGTVRYVEPAAFTKISALGVEEQRVNVVGVLDQVPPGLGAGFRVDASIVVWSGADVLTVPTAALFRRGNAWAVFVVEDGVARLRPVEVGRRGASAAEVLSGASPGDRVILFPPDDVEDGTSITVEEGPAEP